MGAGLMSIPDRNKYKLSTTTNKGINFFLFFLINLNKSEKKLFCSGRAKEAEDIVEKICYWNDKKFKGKINLNRYVHCSMFIAYHI